MKKDILKIQQDVRACKNSDISTVSKTTRMETGYAKMFNEIETIKKKQNEKQSQLSY